MPEESCHWHYVAPHRIRSGDLALFRCESWGEIAELNRQRFARILQFQGCIAFVGSGASRAHYYPTWSDLLPKWGELRRVAPELCVAPKILERDPDRTAKYNELRDKYNELRELIQTATPAIGYPEALEIAADLLNTRTEGEERQDRSDGRPAIVKYLEKRFTDQRAGEGPSQRTEEGWEERSRS